MLFFPAVANTQHLTEKNRKSEKQTKFGRIAISLLSLVCSQAIKVLVNDGTEY